MISGDSAWRVVRDCIPPNLWIPLLILMSAELSLIILAIPIARIIAENLGIKGWRRRRQQEVPCRFKETALSSNAQGLPARLG